MTPLCKVDMTLPEAQMEIDLAGMLLDSLGVTVADLQAAGADPYDLEPLKAMHKVSTGLASENA
jgi:hypothetical protein